MMDEQLKKTIEGWSIPDLGIVFTEEDFYKCKGCGRWDLRHGYEDKEPYCIGCICKAYGVEIA